MLIPRRSCVMAALAILSPAPESIISNNSTNDNQNGAHSYDALVLGGFLLPESAYSSYVSQLTAVEGFETRVYAYNDPLLLEESDALIQPTTQLLIGHSKGAKTAATWMASNRLQSIRANQPVPSVLIEPVDVDPPNTSKEAHFSVLQLWKENQKVIASTPTLIISAPFTETSKRYGKATNLCAPPGRDARAFFDAACDARAGVNDAAPLTFVEFPTLGHNDVTSSALGGCADGPGRKTGSLAVASVVSKWIQAIRGKEDVTLALQRLQEDNESMRQFSFKVAT